MNLQALIITFGYFQKYKLNLKFKIPDLSVSFSSGKEDSGTEEASGGSGRRVQHHSGGQVGSSDAAQAGGGKTNDHSESKTASAQV